MSQQVTALPDWLAEVKQTLPEWIDDVRYGDGSGRYRYAIEAYEPYDFESSDRIHGAIERIRNDDWWDDEEERDAWIEYVYGLQRQDGFFTENSLEEHVRESSIDGSDDPIDVVRKHLTQSCLEILSRHDVEPEYPVPEEVGYGSDLAIETPAEMVEYLEGLDWTSPWGAGSWAGRTIRMVETQMDYDGQDREAVVQAGIDWLTEHQDPETGAWFEGDNVPFHQQVNGVFKVWIQLIEHGLPVQYPDAVIDLCVAAMEEDPRLFDTPDPCSVFDVAFVLNVALRHTGSREDELAALAGDTLQRLEPMARPDGGFSYEAGGSNGHCGTYELGPEKNQSDAMGASMMTQALPELCCLCDLEDELGWTVRSENVAAPE